METIAVYVVLAVQWIGTAMHVIAIVLGLWAFIDAFLRPAEHFVAAGKRTKGFWLAVTGGAAAVIVLMGAASMFGLLAVVASCVYLADVRPALKMFKPVTVRSRIRKPGRGGPGTGWH
ncbi:DUF2516 family protein [Actinomyces howellii]|uniref:Protein of uncharacterized function (DUF2516) n=1 Tax=Actinomyces howellii TaxID=52771 RepID=A0A448HGT3_9ACTO|nr:DUF2516 family protein [Actinomyces howellii]VEG27988.1 Protein of uncharacterised function (DUF2516) [Actinomyces howellii]